MRHFPIFLDLTGRRALVVGDGPAAARKAAALRDAGAVVTSAARYIATDLPGTAIAIGAEAPEADLRRLFADASAAGIPVNCVDKPALCSYITPAIVDRAPLTIAISSGGAAPVLARLARAKIEAVLPPAFARLGVLAARFKEAMRQRFPDMTARRRVLEQLFTGPAADLVYAGREAEAEAAFAAALDSKPASTGMVYLVGAGPGAADLLTLRAQRLLGEADTIVYDRLVSPDVLALRRRDAHTIFVGKTGAQHSLPQAEISALLARLAAEGQRVVRLKGGDPLIFGHAAEEMAALAAAGIAFEIVPGVTAALACAASAGIALTHKDAARTVTFASGHEAPDWAALAGSGGTIALYMSAASLTPLFRGLTAAGLAADTPAALIENGGTAHARVLALPFAALLDAAPGWLRDAPALLLLGAAVAHRVVSSPQG